MSVTNVTADAETFTANVYLLEGEHTTLIDAGAMPGIVETLHSQVDRIDDVIITHQHSDHVDQLAAIVDEFAPRVRAYADHPLRTHVLSDGDQVLVGDDSYEILHTPGHADDHIVLIGENAIFSGDVVVYNDGAFENGSFGRTDLAGQSRSALIQSVDRILDRLPKSIEWMYPGHGEVYHGDVRAVIERALRRARRREPKYPES